MKIAVALSVLVGVFSLAPVAQAATVTNCVGGSKNFKFVSVEMFRAEYADGSMENQVNLNGMKLIAAKSKFISLQKTASISDNEYVAALRYNIKFRDGQRSEFLINVLCSHYDVPESKAEKLVSLQFD